MTTVKTGDVVTVQVSARSYGGPLQHVAVVDLLPGGFEMDLSSSLSSGTASGDESGDVISDRREDRMIFFTSLDTEPSTFTFRIRAVNRGRYALPPVHAEAMYDSGIRAYSSGGSITVE